MGDVPEPISDDELLFRRVPVSTGWFDPTSGILQSAAFAPHKLRDITGLSVSRAKYKTSEQAAQGQPGKSYYVAVFTAFNVNQLGMTVVPRPEVPGGYDPAHAELPELNSGNYKETITLERQEALAKACLRVEGPFETPIC